MVLGLFVYWACWAVMFGPRSPLGRFSNPPKQSLSLSSHSLELSLFITCVWSSSPIPCKQNAASIEQRNSASNSPPNSKFLLFFQTHFRKCRLFRTKTEEPPPIGSAETESQISANPRRGNSGGRRQNPGQVQIPPQFHQSS